MLIDTEIAIIDGFSARDRSSELIGVVETIAIEDAYREVVDLFHRRSTQQPDAITVEDCKLRR